MNKKQIITIVAIILGLVLIAVLVYVFTKHKSSSDGGNCIPSDWILKDTSTSKVLNIPPRRMFGWGAYADNEIGYCGESAVQQALIYYGNYISQPQVNKAAGGSLLPGSSTSQAYHRLQVLYEDCPVGHTWQDLFAYLKKQFDNNYPVVAGLYVLEEGDEDYDHVCVMYGYETDDKGNLTKFIYNDAYQLRPVTMDCTLGDNGSPKCWVTRKEFLPSDDSNASAALLPCALPNVSKKKDPDGSPATENLSAIQGNVDPLGELFPVLLEMSNPYEANWGSEDQVYAPPIPIECIARTSCLTKGVNYSLLRFDNPDDLPVEGKFLESSTWTLRVDFTAKGDTYSVKVTNTHDYPFLSNGTYFFRCVVNTNNTIASVYPLGSNLTDTKPDFAAPDSPDDIRGLRIIRTGKAAKSLKGLRPRRKNKQPRRRKNSSATRKPKVLHDLRLSRSTTNSSTKSWFGNECKDEVPLGKTGVVCAPDPPDYPDQPTDSGDITTYWNWHFPVPFPGWKDAPNPGCVRLAFTPTDRAPDEYPCCMKFTIDTVDPDDSEIFSPTDSPTDPDMGDDNDGFIGLDGRMYIGCDELQVFMAFSLDKAEPDGSFTMVSADGVTLSKIIPVKGPK